MQPDTTKDKPRGNRVPQVGDAVYLPASPGLNLFHGGLTTVVAVTRRGHAEIRVEADPDRWIPWYTIANQQHALWREFGATPARRATAEEIQAFHDEVAREKAAADEAERQRWLPKRFAALNGGLLAVPVWDDSARAKNWAAIIEVDGTAPGGLRRFWFNRGNGPVFYIVPPQLEVGDAVEFAADYVRVSGRRDPTRWYGVVRAIAKDHLLLQPYPDVTAALLEAHSLKPG
jgi:hypothetical protein